MGSQHSEALITTLLTLHYPSQFCHGSDLILSQANHKVLSEEHSQLLNRQVGVTSQRTSLRQQLLSMDEQYAQARAQVGQSHGPVLVLT